MGDLFEFPEVNPGMSAFNGLKTFCDTAGPFSFCMVLYKRPGSDEISWAVPQGATSKETTIGILTKVIHTLLR